jgi:hypothetical protein
MNCDLRCHLFNTTADQDGKPFYIGGLRCSGDGQHYAVAEGFNKEVHMPKLSFSTKISSFVPFFVLRFVFLMVLQYMWEYFD